MTPIDIRPADLETVRRILREHVPAVEVRAFGSRVSWNARETSDLDLAVMADEPLGIDRTAKLRAAFTDSDLPFRVDIVDWATVSESFRQRILKNHVVLTRLAVEVQTSTKTSRAGADDGTSRKDWRNTHWGDLVTLEYGRALRTYGTGEGEFRVFGTNGPIGWHNEALSKSPSVIVGRKGAYRGIHYSHGPCFVIDTAFYLRPKAELDVRWAYYTLLTQDINGLDSGSAIPSTSREDFYGLPVYVPPLAEQRAIAHVLGTLDDKIELNRRMNATLEAMARALFRSWFVDFDPVRAKMEDRDTGLPQEIADLFPDRLVDSELGEVPEGWNVDSLAEHFDPVKGVSYKGSGLSGTGMPLHNLNSVHEGGGYKYEGIKFYAGDYADRHVVRPGDVIVANTEQGHDRLLIGYAAIVPRCFGDQGICSHHVYRLRRRRGGKLSPLFLHQLLNSPWMHGIVSRYANGTTVNMLPMDAVQKPMVLVPPRALLETFDALALDLEHRREQTVQESRSLGVVRDALLPKLVSGEVRVAGLEAPNGDPGLSAAVGTHGA